MLLNFLSPEFFPDDVLKVLSKHIINPKASTFSDLELVKVLRKYDNQSLLTISDIEEGGEFSLTNGKTFIKGKNSEKDLGVWSRKQIKSICFIHLRK